MKVMPGLMGGIPSQIGGDLKGIAEEAMKQTVKAGSDVVAGTIEQISVAPSQVGQKAAGDKRVEQGQTGNDPQATARKKAEEKRQFETVRSELAQYIQRKKELDAKIAQEKEQENQVKEQKEAQEKQKRESFTASLLKRVSGQSHGEVMKSKD